MAITYHAGRRIQGLSVDPNTSLTPSVESDYTNSSWSTQVNTSGTYWQIANNSQEFQGRLVNSGSGSNYDLGTSFQNINQWTLRFEITVDSNKEVQFNGDCITMFGIQSGTTMAGTSGGSGGSYSSSRAQAQFQIATANSTRKFQGQFETGTSVGQDNSHFTMTYSNDTKYYIELKKTGSTSYTLSAGTNSDYATGRTSSNITGVSLSGLRYLHMETWNQNSSYESRNGGKIENLKIWTDNPKPTNAQVGSRFEETDTRKMYYYEPQVGDYDYPMTTDPRTNTFNSSLCTITHANSTLQMNQITNGGAGGSATYIDLGSNLSTKWVMRFKTKQTAYTSYANNSQFQVGMSSVAPTSTAYNISSSLNWIGIRWYYGTQIWSGGSRVGIEPRINQNTGDNTHNNATWNGGGGDQRLYGSPREVSDTTTPYYHEIIWNVDTFTYNLYTNENYTGTPASTATMSSSTNTQWVTGTPSSISGLRYFVFKEGDDSSMGVWVNQLDDVEIWDGVIVAATGNAWKEIGT